MITDGDHGSAEYADSGVPFILSEAVSNGWVDIDACRYITPAHAKTLKRSELKGGDVLVTKTGIYFGKSAVVPPDLIGGNMIAHVGLLRLRVEADPYFVSTFLNSRYGHAQLRRRGIKATRPEIKLVEFDDIRVPLVSENLQKQIRKTLFDASSVRADAVQHLTEAETYILNALGLGSWQPPEPLTYVSRASEVAAGRRFDSVYFSPAKTESARILSRGGAKPLSAYFEPIRDMVAPEEVGTGKRILNFDVGAAAQPIIDDTTPSVEDFESTKKRFFPGDVIISRLRHYLRQIAVVRTDTTAIALGSSEFIVLRPRSDALPQEALVLFLRCLPVQTILKYSQDGSHHPRFSEDDLLAIPVPDALLALAPTLTAAVHAAHAARREAQSLLARAQRAVEVAIEQGEPAALKLLAE